MTQLTVAEVINLYLPKTQTFVYGLLSNFAEVRPVVFAAETVDEDVFPWDDLVVVPTGNPLESLFDKASRRLTGRRPVRERRYREAVERTEARVIHGHFGWSAPTTLPLKRSLDIPLVTTFYGADMSALPRLKEWEGVYRELFELGDLFLVEGEHMKKCLAELGCPEDRITVHHIGVNTGGIRFRERTFAQGDEVRILMCSTFSEKKGVPFGIEAFAQVRSKQPGARLLVAGDGPDREAIEKLVLDLGLSDAVELLGFVDHSRFFQLMEDAHIFLAPSVTAKNGDTEGGAPTVLLEAQAAGLPVVSTHHADIPGVVADGVSGLLAPERDSEALAACLLQLMDNPAMLPLMGSAGRRRMCAEYDVVHQARKLEDLYRSLSAH